MLELHEKMITTYQFKNQSILDHGLSVHKHYKNILKALDNRDLTYYQLPDILVDNWDTLKTLLYPTKTMKMYHIYHDCGKPYCRTIDDSGKQHFPNHSQKSYEIFLEAFSDLQDKQIIAKFIQKDMTFHSSSMEEIDNFLYAFGKEFCFSLWLTSLAELYSNREMFDADNQLSFKIKYKKLMRILKKITNDENLYHMGHERKQTVVC